MWGAFDSIDVNGVTIGGRPKIRWAYAITLCNDPSATRDDLRESMEMFEDLERTARRVLGGAHPFTKDIERNLRVARAALASEGDDVSAVIAALEALKAT